ncbi:MAG: hypothetical protein ABI885_17730 [Gammaproteobacteria bacterium]
MRRILASTLIAAACLAGFGATPAYAGDTKCSLDFTMSGWSAFYKTASGSGTVHCSNGQSMKVKLDAKGGGLTVGKSTIENGHGEFSGISGGIDELLGSYISGEAHAGAVKSSAATVMTKGEVSLALSGTGKGWDLGVAFGRLSIKRAK